MAVPKARAVVRPLTTLCMPFHLRETTRSAPISELPFAQMHPAIDVQNLAGHLTGFSEIEHGFCNVLGCGYCSKRRKCAQKLLGNVLEQRRRYDARSYGVHANSLLRVLHREAAGDCVDAALGNHWHRSGE